MMPSIGSKIKDLRAKLKINQEDICCDILSQTILSRIENDKMLPSIPQLEHIANCMGVRINYFFEENRIDYELLNNLQENISYLKVLYEQKKYDKILYLYEIGELRGWKDAGVYYYVGMSYYNMQLYNISLTILRKYITGYKKMDDSRKKEEAKYYAAALNKLHCIMLRNSNFEKAVKYLYQAKAELEKYEKTNIRIYFVVINNIGSTYCISYKFNEAIRVLEKFLETYKDIISLQLMPCIHVSLSIAYYSIKNYKEALKHIKDAIWLFEYTGQNSYADECYLNYIDCLRFELKLNEALELAEKLINKYFHDPKMLNLFRNQKMIVLFNMKRFDALYLLSKEIDLKELRKRSKMEYYFMTGHVELIRKEYTKAYNLLKRCETYLRNNKFFLDLSLLYKDLACITGNPEFMNEAIKYGKMDGICNIMLSSFDFF